MAVKSFQQANNALVWCVMALVLMSFRLRAATDGWCPKYSVAFNAVPPRLCVNLGADAANILLWPGRNSRPRRVCDITRRKGVVMSQLRRSRAILKRFAL